MHFLQKMEEKQVRQCQAPWQLNPHRDGVFSSFWPTTQTWGSTVRLIKQMKYFSNIFPRRFSTWSKGGNVDNFDALDVVLFQQHKCDWIIYHIELLFNFNWIVWLLATIRIQDFTSQLKEEKKVNNGTKNVHKMKTRKSVCFCSRLEHNILKVQRDSDSIMLWGWFTSPRMEKNTKQYRKKRCLRLRKSHRYVARLFTLFPDFKTNWV